MIKKAYVILIAISLLAILLINPALAAEDPCIDDPVRQEDIDDAEDLHVHVFVDGYKLDVIVKGIGTVTRPDGSIYDTGRSFASGYQPDFLIMPGEEMKLISVTFNDQSIISTVEANGYLKLPPIIKDSVLVVVFEGKPQETTVAATPNPTDPTGPDRPAESTGPNNSTGPIGPINPTESTGYNKPTEPVGSDKPTGSTKTGSESQQRPKTGIIINLYFWITIFGLALLSVPVLTVSSRIFGKKRKKDEDAALS